MPNAPKNKGFTDSLDHADVARMLRSAEQEIERLHLIFDRDRQRSLELHSKDRRYIGRLEAQLELLSPECPDCAAIRVITQDQRANVGMHQADCPETNGRPDLIWNPDRLCR